MHGYALQRRLQNVGITVSTLHPGFVQTEALRHIQSVFINALVKLASRKLCHM